ncbi:MAG TPA: biotin/lipoyl-containing protein [Steroidobacteraceae bacterium]|nr:biotin/lipoyl-containing protein [Steroidobacteraceae bacterium]
MAVDINMKMPDLATNEGADVAVARWLIAVGQLVKRGEVLLEVETDKAVQEVECIATGVLKAIHVQAGVKVPVGTIIATLQVS